MGTKIIFRKHQLGKTVRYSIAPVFLIRENVKLIITRSEQKNTSVCQTEISFIPEVCSLFPVLEKPSRSLETGRMMVIINNNNNNKGQNYAYQQR